MGVRAKLGITADVYWDYGLPAATWKMLELDGCLNWDQYWFQPASGFICIGPHCARSAGEIPEHSLHYFNPDMDPGFDSEFPQVLTAVSNLDLERYKSDKDIIQHVERCFGDFLQFAKLMDTVTGEGVSVDKTLGWAIPLGSVVSLSDGKVVAETYPPLDFRVSSWERQGKNSTPLQLDNGWTRYDDSVFDFRCLLSARVFFSPGYLCLTFIPAIEFGALK